MKKFTRIAKNDIIDNVMLYNIFKNSDEDFAHELQRKINQICADYDFNAEKILRTAAVEGTKVLSKMTLSHFSAYFYN